VKGPARFLFVNDGFIDDTYELFFTIQLMYSDREITVDRLRNPTRLPDLDQHYDHVFDYEHDRYFELDNTNTRRAVELRIRPGESLADHFEVGPGRMPNLVKDVLWNEGSWRWTLAEPQLRFDLKERRDKELYVVFTVASATLKAGEPKIVAFSVNGHELGRASYAEEGEKEFSRPVPDEWLQTQGPTLVTMRVENPFVANDGVKLGVLLQKAGFRTVKRGGQTAPRSN
jgi:hypothetical protein